jgi:cytochrome b pre-mRNA-processing protein 3
MILDRLFRPRPARVAGKRLYAAAVAAARAPRLYAELGVPDTVEGRFELYTLHVLLLIERLRAGGGAMAADTSQALFDAYIKGLDDGLREMGVSDTSVGKKMRKLGEAFYGRGKSYEAAIAALPDEAPLAAFLHRTAYADGPGRPEALVGDVLAKRRALADAPLDSLLAGEPSWSHA